MNITKEEAYFVARSLELRALTGEQQLFLERVRQAAGLPSDLDDLSEPVTDS